jgi:hypothetical protein
VEVKLNSMVSQVRVLFDRQLYRQCGKMIRRAQKIARKHERYPTLMALLMWQTVLERYVLAVPKVKQLSRENFEHEISILHEFEGLVRMRRLSNELFVELEQHGSDRFVRSVPQSAKSLIDEADEVASEHPESFMIQALYLDLASAFYEGRGQERETTFRIRQRLIDLLKQYPDRVRERPHNLAYGLRNLVVSAARAGHYDAADAYLAELWQVPTLKLVEGYYNKMEGIVLERGCSLTVFLPLHRDNWPQAAKAAESLEQTLEERLPGMTANYQLDISLMMALAYLAVNDYSNSQRWVNVMLNFNDVGLRRDLQLLARVVFVLLLLATEEWELLSYRLNSFRQFIRRHSLEDQPEVKLVLSIRPSIKAATASAPEVWSGLAEVIDAHADLPQLTSEFATCFNLKAWVHHHLSRVYPEGHR